MFKLIDKIRKKDNRSKNRTALVVSIVITLFIGIVWGFSFFHKIQAVTQGNSSSPSIFGSISSEFQKILESVQLKDK